MANINHFLGAFASDSLANAHVASVGWTVPGAIGGATCYVRKPGLKYYHTMVGQVGGIRTWNGTAWIEEGTLYRVAIPANNDATPTVLGLDALSFGANTNPLTITNLDDGVNGQIVGLYCSNAGNPPAINDGGNFRLAGNFVGSQYDVLVVVRVNGIWYELTRSAN